MVPNVLVIELKIDMLVQAEYCYIVTASNDTFSVYVEGQFQGMH